LINIYFAIIFMKYFYLEELFKLFRRFIVLAQHYVHYFSSFIISCFLYCVDELASIQPMNLIVVKIDHKFYSLYHTTTPHKIHLSSKDLIVYFEKKITFHNQIFFDLILLYQILIFV
jgi:hypothetical protein